MEENDPLNEREFELINIIGAELGANQRHLSHLMNLSLGMTNMLIRRLIAKGYIRIRQLNKRKAEYLLTPKGFSEKVRKSVKYTLKTVNSIGLIKNRAKEFFAELYHQGERNFYILGSSDFVTLIEMVLKEDYFKDSKIVHIQEIPEQKVDGIILICQENVSENLENVNKKINLLHELEKRTPPMYNHFLREPTHAKQ